MSVWNIGADDVSEEAQAIKDRLASKDSQIASHQNQIMRQSQELDELRSTLNDTIHKLAKESERALRLETDLSHCSDDLRNEKVLSQNTRITLEAAEQKLVAKDLHARDLESTILKVSNEFTQRDARIKDLEKEKTVLKTRLLELQSEAIPIQRPHTTPQHTTSEVASLEAIAGLERELTETRQRLATRESDLHECKQRLSDAQTATTKVENEKIALHKQFESKISELTANLAEHTDEVEFLRSNEEGFRREEELLERIEEDEAKIAALEALLRSSDDSNDLKRRLRQMEGELQNERHKLVLAESSRVSLTTENERIQEEMRVVRMLESQSQLTQRDVSSLNIDADVEMDSPTNFPELPNAVITYIERLLAAIERIRDDRNNLRRNLEFLETESKFSIDALESQLTSKTNELEIQKARRDEGAVNERIADSNAINVKHLEKVAMVSAITVGCLSEYIESSDLRLADALTSNQHMRGQVVQAVGVAEEKINKLEQQLRVATASLEDLSQERDTLKSQWESLRYEREQMKLEDLDKDDTLQQLGQQFHEVTKQLSDVESERDSLSVQVTNLLADLTKVQTELESAESRYSTLQFQQLSDMTSNEATHALREQIEQLEMRVMRRTEQIGIHQHDIRRLETNLRLQEERLGEMTVELETIGAQKAAMVEDCADAREARDHALARVELLEDELENMENRNQISDYALEQTIATYIQTADSSKTIIKSLNNRIQDSGRAFSQLQIDYDNTQHLLLNSRDAIITLRRMLDAMHDDQCQAVVAFSVSQLALKTSTSALQHLRENQRGLVCKMESANSELEQKRLEVSELTQQARALRELSSSSSSELVTQTSKLEALVSELRSTISTQNNEHKSSMDIASSEITDLKAKLQHYEDLAHRHSETQAELEGLKTRQENDIEDIQSQLQSSLQTIEELHSQLADAETAHQKSISVAKNSQEELKEQLEAALNDSSNYRRLQEELSSVTKQHSEDIVRLQTALDKADAENNTLSTNLAKAQTNHREIEDTLAKLSADHKLAFTQVENEFNSAKQALEENTAQLMAQSESLSQELENARSETRRLTRILEEENRSKEESAKGMEILKTKSNEAQLELTTLREDILVLRSKVEELQHMCAMADEEKLSLQEELTAKDAEIQKFTSLQRFLENQVQESAATINALNDELEQVRADLSQAEKSSKAAEVNSSIQAAQHRREMNDLKREFEALQSQPNLEQALADLEERNSEMEELLRAKCTEIEENDDRALEMLKENKKLAAKVETLSRKVQNLQAKLAAAKAVLPSVHGTSTGAKTAPTEESGSRPRIFSGPAPHSNTNNVNILRDRSVSLAPRSKTPERRIIPVPVFKAKTPEKPQTRVDSDAPESSISAGKKRRAPDDFDEYMSVPAQAFTADSVPRDENNKTPRIRRALSSLQSSFTPVRHQISRPIISMSPKRSAIISDVTNSPHGASDSKSSKRSWLGKIRGSSSQTTFSAPGREG
ncbi:hypothetical protein BDQ17DRAFT_1295683 [Cyathus striatus]|nr:hypothetical protein BDQ17DRAFT_1295683 [Cyathus striatus]